MVRGAGFVVGQQRSGEHALTLCFEQNFQSSPCHPEATDLSELILPWSTIKPKKPTDKASFLLCQHPMICRQALIVEENFHKLRNRSFTSLIDHFDKLFP